MEKVNRHITLELNSPGGDIEAGLLIIDTIKLCKRKVVVRATGIAQSMATVILACGHIREALPNCSIMVHQGTYWFKERYHDLDNEVSEVKRLEALCLKLMDEHTKKAPGYWENKCGVRNLYLTADIALREGLIDKICSKG
jgi:ATP-dependent Clp protease protease subunit